MFFLYIIISSNKLFAENSYAKFFIAFNLFPILVIKCAQEVNGSG